MNREEIEANKNSFYLLEMKPTIQCYREFNLYKQFYHAYQCRWDNLAENEMRNFALRDKDGNEIGVFSGKQPRQAALKAANRGHTDIKLRERGTKKVHVFTGERVQVKKPKDAPAWMPDKIWMPKVKKVGMENLEPPVEKVVVVKRRK
jgi:hypothetical protein